MKSLHNASTPPTAGNAEVALERLFELAVVLGEFMERGLVERGLTRARARVIWQLHREGPVTQRALAEALGVTPRNITGLVDALTDDGFVVRGPHPSDRRASLISLTDKGSSVAAALRDEEQAFARLLFEGVPPEDLTAFLATLDHVLEWLRGPDGPP
jgi:DNA-binding MarR family transcriptional regulator